MHSSPEFRSLKAKIRVLCKQRRIRLEEFMKTFDIHRVKKIQVEQFKRALDMSGLQLSPTEVALLLAKYRLPDDPSFVHYRRFCDLIDKVFTIKGLEATPSEVRGSLRPDVPSGGGTGTALAAAPLSERERELLHAAQTKLLAAVMHKGIVLKDVFHDFDRSHAGKVTKTQFVRDVLDIVALAPDELAVLLKAYSDDSGLDVHYRTLHFDICPGAAGAGTQAAAPRSPDRRHFSAPASIASMATSMHGNRGDSSAVRDLEATLAALVVRDRIRTKNFFSDFDPLRTGKCSEPQFKRCAKLCFNTLTEHDLELLVRKYVVVPSSSSGGSTFDSSSHSNKVEYVRFCNTVEGKRSSTHEADNDDVLSSIVASTTLGSTKCSREQRVALSEREFDVLTTVLQRLGAFCATRRVLVKPVFQDFDKSRREYVTLDQFVRVLTLCKLPLVNDTERRVVLKRYASSHGDRFVNYVTFCYDLEHSNASGSDSSSNGRPASRGGSVAVASEILSPATTLRPSGLDHNDHASTGNARSVPMLIRYIKQVVKRDRIRLDEYYRDYDKLRHGHVTAAQFAAGLSASGFVLSKAEMQALSDEYATRGGGGRSGSSSAADSAVVLDSAGQRLVAWKSFVDDIESVFTTKYLERTPASDVESLRGSAMRSADQFGGVQANEHALSRDDERVATRALVTMKRAIDRQRLSIKPAFEDFDRLKQGFISSTKFERVLSMFNLLPADAAHARVVVLKFREQTASVSSAATLSSVCDVNYRAFLHALDLVGNAGSDTDALILPGSVAYRQDVLDSGAGYADTGVQRAARDQRVGLTDIQTLLTELQRQLNARRIRIKEFVTDGDKLRTGEVTVAKFHTALNRSGCVLDATDVSTLSAHFRSAKHADKIDWRAFLDALDRVNAGTRSNDRVGTAGGPGSDASEAPSDSDAVALILERLRREVAQRRLHMKPYFQDYDHSKLSRVSQFQFAAVLDMMQLHVSPRDVQALATHFAVRDGRKVTTDVNYLALVQAVDAIYQ